MRQDGLVITVRGVDPGIWKEFQRSVNERHGALGQEVTKALGERIEKMKTEPVTLDTMAIRNGFVNKQIYDAMEALGREATISQVREYLVQKNGTFDHDVSTAMGDLAVNGTPSSRYKHENKFLRRISRGKYKLEITK